MEPCVDRIVDPDKCGSTLNQSLQLLLYLPSVIHPPPPPLSQSKAKNMRVTVTGKLEPGVTSKVGGGGHTPVCRGVMRASLHRGGAI